jgi:cytochrome c oxidase subunit 2
MQSADVIHSFWIPAMGQKQDLVPGIITHVVVTPTRTGTFTLVCTELCGLGHATMRAPVRVVSQADFAAWAKEQQAGGSRPPAGAAVFASAGCGGCHTFTPAGSTGEVGPNLDNVAADAAKAGEDPAAYVRESILNPNKVVVDGYKSDVMPQSYADSLSVQEIDALVAYLTETK